MPINFQFWTVYFMLILRVFGLLALCNVNYYLASTSSGRSRVFDGSLPLFLFRISTGSSVSKRHESSFKAAFGGSFWSLACASFSGLTSCPQIVMSWNENKSNKIKIRHTRWACTHILWHTVPEMYLAFLPYWNNMECCSVLLVLVF